MNLLELNTATQTQKTQSEISPSTALELLKDGIRRFVEKQTSR